MLYFLAVICPPLAVLFCKRPGSFLINLILTIFFFIPGMIHAILIVADTKAEKRNQQVVEAIKSQKGGQ